MATRTCASAASITISSRSARFAAIRSATGVPLERRKASARSESTTARMLSARLILEQTTLYLIMGKIVSMRHPKFFTREWTRVRWRASTTCSSAIAWYAR